MDLVVIFTFVAMVVLIITAGVVLWPISRKLGVYLEEAAIERRESRLSGAKPMTHQQALPAAPQELLDTLSRMESQMSAVADRQAFVEELLERKQVASDE